MTDLVITPPSVYRPRGLATEALSETGSILAGTVIDDGGGGGTVTQVVQETTICRIDALGGSESEIANRISDRSTHLVTLPPFTEITTDNDFQITDRGTYEVTAVREHTGEFARTIEVVPRT